MMSLGSSVTHLQRLCCSGLDGQTFIPELLRDLHGIVGSRSNAFLWCDERFEISNAYGEDPVFLELTPVYLSEFHDRRTLEVTPSFRQYMEEAATVTNILDLVGEHRFYDSAWYHEIVRHLAWRNIAYTKISSGSRPLGQLIQGLDVGKGGPTDIETRSMLMLAPFIAHALGAARIDALGHAESDDAGVLLVSLRGKLEYVSPAARRLLFLTDYPRINRAAFEQSPRRELPPFVTKLCDDLAAVFDRAAGAASAPSYTHCNEWGRFIYRAQWLNGIDKPGRVVAITVQRQIPTELLLLRRLKSLGLPTKQADVCFHLASGTSYAAIAEKLGMSIHAVRWHTRELYARLDVHSAAQLGQKLLSDAAFS